MLSFKNSRKEIIHNLLIQGYSQERIAEKLNISPKIVKRDIYKIREGDKQWFENLAKGEFLSKYRETLDVCDDQLIKLYEVLEKASVKNDPNLELKIITQISKVNHSRGELLHKGPMVWSLTGLLNKCNPEKIPLPVMSCLEGFQN